MLHLLLILLIPSISTTANETETENTDGIANATVQEDSMDFSNDDEDWLVWLIIIIVILAVIVGCIFLVWWSYKQRHDLEHGWNTDNLAQINRSKGAANQSGSSYIPPVYNPQHPQYQAPNQVGFTNNSYAPQYPQQGIPASQGPHYETAHGYYPVIPSAPTSDLNR